MVLHLEKRIHTHLSSLLYSYPPRFKIVFNLLRVIWTIWWVKLAKQLCIFKHVLEFIFKVFKDSLQKLFWQITQGQFDDRYVLSSRVRTGRSIRGLSLPPACSRAERRAVESVVVTALAGLKGDLAGKYYSLTTMSNKEQQQLIDASTILLFIIIKKFYHVFLLLVQGSLQYH